MLKTKKAITAVAVKLPTTENPRLMWEQEDGNVISTSRVSCVKTMFLPNGIVSVEVETKNSIYVINAISVVESLIK